MVYFFARTFFLYGENISLQDKYNLYRNRILDEWIVVSPNVEQFGTNIPAMERTKDKNGNVTWVSWSDGNANFNHWLGFLATEYRILKNSNQDYSETLKLLLYSMMAIERLDLYSEYILRKYHNIKENENSTESGFIKYPEDINGFLIRDDVSLGFWKQYHLLFNCQFGNINENKDGTTAFLSVFLKGAIPRQGMSQDNICYLMQSLALVKKLVDTEDIENIELNFINTYIPDYLKSKKIWEANNINFGLWVDDIINRLISNVCHHYPAQKIVLKPKNRLHAKPSDNHFAKILSSYWYIKNPVTNDLVAEGNGEDMGVFINSYGFAESADIITGQKIHHTDNSDIGLAKYFFKSVLFKNFKIFYIAAIPIPETIDDYMIRAFASIADINWHKNSYELMYLLRDKRKKWTYEHYPLILYILHKEKYSKIFNLNTVEYYQDKQYLIDLLNSAPLSYPTSDTELQSFDIQWCSASRLNWPHKLCCEKQEYSGLDFLFLYNLFCTVFDSENYKLNKFEKNKLDYKKILENYPIPEMKEKEIEYIYLPPKHKNINTIKNFNTKQTKF